jgi:hypothetical protein
MAWNVVYVSEFLFTGNPVSKKKLIIKNSGNGKGWSSFLYKRLQKDWENQPADVITLSTFPETVHVCEFQDYNFVPNDQ